jgi:type IV pilus assembly protein PilW
MKHLKQRGLSLIELLVALSIGAFLIIGAVTVQSQTRKTFTVNESQARLQETARYALSVLEPDIQLASLYGYTNNPWGMKLIDKEGNTVPAKNMQAGQPAINGVSGVYDACGTNAATNVAWPIEAEDGAWTKGCAPKGNGQIPGTDTLTVRHSGTEKVDGVDGRMQIFSNRLAVDDTRIIFNGKPPAPHDIEDGLTEIRDYFMRQYYVAQDSEGRPNLPALRVKQISFDDEDSKPEWDDQEVVRGVEDVQIEFGVDTGDPDLNGVVRLTPEGVAVDVNGNVGRWVAPGNEVLKSAQVVAVRLWIRVRAEEPEQGFLDQRVYTYGSVKDFQPGDAFRRAVVSRTIFLRNTRIYPQS